MSSTLVILAEMDNWSLTGRFALVSWEQAEWIIEEYGGACAYGSRQSFDADLALQESEMTDDLYDQITENRAEQLASSPFFEA